MNIGVPKETMDLEFRVSVTPAICGLLVKQGHRVLVQQRAGEGAGYPDAQYAAAGATIVASADDAWAAELVVKVKQPLPPEYLYLRPELQLYTYLHLAAEPELTRLLVERGVSAVAAETVQAADGSLPALAPMSEIAGKMTLQVAAYYLSKYGGGIGKLLQSVVGVPPGHVVVVGGGTVGTAAARMALGVGASVTVMDRSHRRLTYLEEAIGGHLVTMLSNDASLAEMLPQADVVVGAVLVPGGRAPKVISRDLVKTMQPGSVVIDVSIDQGGCLETSRPTHHSDPVYIEEGVIHYCVVNMPGIVPRTASHAYASASYPYVAQISAVGVRKAATDPAIAAGVNVFGGQVTYPAVAAALGYPVAPLAGLLGAA